LRKIDVDAQVLDATESDAEMLFSVLGLN